MLGWKYRILVVGILCLAAAPAPPVRAYLDAETSYTMALKYETGSGRPRNYITALVLYCRADSDGHAAAAAAVARMYALGHGLKRDNDLAAAWYRRAAARGHEDSKQMVRVFRGAKPKRAICPYGRTWATPQALARAPEEVRKIVETLAPDYKLDPKLVLAMIAVESSFQADAVSAKNAQGLMQLIPATAARFGVGDVFDPVENIRGGMAYLRWLLQNFEGNVTLAVAAYNAGEGAVTRYGGVPPYAETRNYVKKIHALYPSLRHPI